MLHLEFHLKRVEKEKLKIWRSGGTVAGAKPLLEEWMDADAELVGGWGNLPAAFPELLLRVCGGSLCAVAAVISTVADVVGCAWRSRRGRGQTWS